MIRCSSRTARPASSRRALASTDPGRRASRCALPADSCALRFMRAGEDLRQAGVLEVAGGVAGPPVGPLAGLLHLPLLPLDLLLGVADVASRPPPARRCTASVVRGEVAAVPADLAAVQLGDAVHPVEQRPVVADQQQAAGPVGRARRRACAGPRGRGCWSARRAAARRAACSSCAARPSETTWPPLRVSSRRSRARSPRPSRSSSARVRSSMSQSSPMVAKCSSLASPDSMACSAAITRGDAEHLGHGQVADQRQASAGGSRARRRR